MIVLCVKINSRAIELHACCHMTALISYTPDLISPAGVPYMITTYTHVVVALLPITYGYTCFILCHFPLAKPLFKTLDEKRLV